MIMPSIFCKGTEPLGGWHGVEWDPDTGQPFGWTERIFSLSVILQPHWNILCLDILSPFPSCSAQAVIEDRSGNVLDLLVLRQGQRRYFVRLLSSDQSASRHRIEMKLNREMSPLEKQHDPRQLGVRLYSAAILHSEESLAQADWTWIPGPRVMTIETSTKCNFSCPMCFRALDDYDVPRPSEMSEENIEKIISLARKSECVALHGLGEPLLSKACFLLLDRLHGSHPAVGFNTNGSLVDDRVEKAILEGKISWINFSLDAATTETYRKLRNFDLDITLSHIRNVLGTRLKAGLAKPKVFMNMTLMRQNIQEATLFVELANELGVDGVHFWLMHEREQERKPHGKWKITRGGFTFDYSRQLLGYSPEKSNECLGKALQRARELGVTVHMDPNRPMFFSDEDADSAQRDYSEEETHFVAKPASRETTTPHALLEYEEPRYCHWIWDEALILSDGSVKSCYFQEEGDAGNLDDVHDFADIWNGPILRGMRAAVAVNRLPLQCRDKECKFRLRSHCSLLKPGVRPESSVVAKKLITR
jgi:MoaA/NifB/PqqE/SkfB family radical SAM enzyme